ncbi:MAG: ribulose-phosphate 3-epimerase [Clostridiales bacterium]|nr:ribulose-phosphate 3-epimerase [Clostridiales bacterium]
MNRVEVAPSLLSADFGYLMRDIKSVEDSCSKLHIDVMDGHFVPNLSFGIPVIRSIRKYTDMIFDVHLMIDNPDEFIETFVKAGADRITFHIECTDDPEALAKKIRSFGKKAGIAIHPDTPVEKLFPYLPFIDNILIMSVVPGFGGQGYMKEATGRIRAVREELDRIGSSADLSVDGGINIKTCNEVAGAGCNVLVAGSAVFDREDPAEGVREILECVSQS